MMEPKKLSKEEKLERELKTLVERMKNENAALQKILTLVNTTESEMQQKNSTTEKANENKQE